MFFLTKTDSGAFEQLDVNHLKVRQEHKDKMNHEKKQKMSQADSEKIYDDMGILHKNKKAEKQDASGMGDFMTLFLEQLKNQNPLDPQDGAEFVAQLAQFNSVERLHKIDESLGKLVDSFSSSRILEATGMIGKYIEVPTNNMVLESEKDGDGKTKVKEVTGTLQLPDINTYGENSQHRIFNDVQVTISHENGVVVQRMRLGEWKSGAEIPFSWDASDIDGKRLQVADQEIPDGVYTIRVAGLVGDEWFPADTNIATKVDSVGIDNKTGKITISAQGAGNIDLSELRKIAGQQDSILDDDVVKLNKGSGSKPNEE